MTDEKINVTQADKDAAMSWLYGAGQLADAFARHRTEALASQAAEMEALRAESALLERQWRSREEDILRAAVWRMGWPEINAYHDELNKGQDVREDAGGYFMRAIGRLFGVKPQRDVVTTHQDAAMAMLDNLTQPPTQEQSAPTPDAAGLVEEADKDWLLSMRYAFRRDEGFVARINRILAALKDGATPALQQSAPNEREALKLARNCLTGAPDPEHIQHCVDSIDAALKTDGGARG